MSVQHGRRQQADREVPHANDEPEQTSADRRDGGKDRRREKRDRGGAATEEEDGGRQETLSTKLNSSSDFPSSAPPAGGAVVCSLCRLNHHQRRRHKPGSAGQRSNCGACIVNVTVSVFSSITSRLLIALHTKTSTAPQEVT